ncbi:cytoplasm protein [Mycena galopus ATCC 62051]|nr:cytoplasm protein [Mycena galopus ATCC 62051]
MSRRGHRSQHSRISAEHRRGTSQFISNDDLFSYVLRVSYLAHLLVPKPEAVATTPEARGPRSNLSALSNFSIGDLFKDVRDGSKSVKFPEKLLKVLEQKLQNIAMGKDPAYLDQLVRRTMAVFYGQFQVESFKRQMKENRKIEELILTFASQATTVLKKEPSLAAEGWKLEVNNQIAVFVKLLSECLRTVNGVSPELLSRLDTYTTKLAPVTGSSDSGYASASTSPGRSMSMSSVSGTSVADMELVRVVIALFRRPESEVQREVDGLRGICTEKAALADLKTCLRNLTAGAPFPGRREDFDTDEAWQHWRAHETTALQQLVVTMVQANPELAKSTPTGSDPAYSAPSRTSSMYAADGDAADAIQDAILSTVNEDGTMSDPIPSSPGFTYIPSNPRKFYKRLLERCLLADLERMLSPEVGAEEEVSLGILSEAHLDLLNACAVRWRIGHPYRAVCFLDLMKQFYERQDIPLECVPEALSHVGTSLGEMELQKWVALDAEYLANVYSGLFSTFIGHLYHCMDAIPALKPAEIEPYLGVLERVRSSELLERFADTEQARLADETEQARIAEVRAEVQAAALRWYSAKLQELQAAPGVNRALPLLFMTDELEKTAKALDTRFPEPLLGQVDLVALVVEVQVPQLLRDIHASQNRLLESPDTPIQDIFTLYRRSKVLLGMYTAFCPEGRVDEFNINAFFEPYVRQWLLTTDSKTGQWVEAAIRADKFRAEGTEGHSSSIVDLFESLRSPIDFLLDLEWEDEFQSARFFTALSRSIAKAIEQYCRTVEDLFMREMFPGPSTEAPKRHQRQQSNGAMWLERARQLALQDKKATAEPFTFRPESCVKLNNVEAARRLLDNMYTQMRADEIAEVGRRLGMAEPERFLFSVKVVGAEGLVPLDHSPSETKLDSFVKLSDDSVGKVLAKTRTLYETLNPRWEETFDLSLDKRLWLTVSVHDHALAGQYDTVGQVHLALDPRRFDDLLTHDLWLDLDSEGRVLVRVSMEAEKDDIQFYFGRAFRSLKRAESDMLRIFIDKMSPFIHQCLSRNVLKSLLKAGGSGLDYNKAISNVTALWSSALGSSSSDVQIPLPSAEKPRTRPEELTDAEIEQAILPLFDYFDASLQTLNTYLSETAKEMVMTRVWKDILLVIEGLLIPPLSDISSDSQPLNDMKPLSDKEVDIVFKWLKFLRDYFHAGGEGPVPLEVLQNQKYRDIVSIRLYYDWHTDALMEECVRVMQQTLRSAPSMRKRAKSIYSQRNLGSIKERKKEKKEEKEVSNGETIMRILRMRPETSDFVAQQLELLNTIQAEQEQRVKELEQRRLNRPSNNVPVEADTPPIPSNYSTY